MRGMPDAPQTSFFPATLARDVIDARHPEYCGEYLDRLEALYAGGRKLLQNQRIMDEVFPKHSQESRTIYAERRARAHYHCVAGEVIGYLVSNFCQDPVSVHQEPKVAKAEPTPLDEWYAKFLKDMSASGGERVPLATYLRDQVEAMLVKRTAWARVDLPPPPAEKSSSLREQESKGELDAFVVVVPAQAVIDWAEDDAGELEWLVTYDCSRPRFSPLANRSRIVERWTIWTRISWSTYEKSRDPKDKIDPTEEIPRVGEGGHTIGRVPFVRTKVKAGLWAMDLLESLAREHLNKRSALAWAELQSLDQQLYEFLGKKDPKGPTIGIEADADRAVNQPRGAGFVQERGAGDDARFIGPDSSSFAEARESCREMSDAMHRTMHLMAMSVEQSAGMLGRSAASKQADMAATVVVLGALGTYVREHAVALMQMVSRARGDTDMIEAWQAAGASNFEATTPDTTISRAIEVEGISIKSETFQRMFQADVAEAWLGERATQAVMDTIQEELAENVTADQFMGMAGGTRDRIDLGGGKEGDTDDDDEPPPKPKKAPPKKPKPKQEKKR